MLQPKKELKTVTIIAPNGDVVDIPKSKEAYVSSMFKQKNHKAIQRLASMSRQTKLPETKKSKSSSVSLMHKGSKGSNVKNIQRKLIEQGYLPEVNANGKSNIDGVFGSLTDTAVREYQKANNLSIDGKVGKNTYGSLMQDAKPDISERTTKAKGTTNIAQRDFRPVTPVTPKKPQGEMELASMDSVIDGVKRKQLGGRLIPEETTLLRKAFNKIIPTSGRTLINDVSNHAVRKLMNTLHGTKDNELKSSDFSTINEKHFTNPQMDVLKKLTRGLLKRGETSIPDYNSWRDIVGMSGESIEDGLFMSNPSNIAGQTLGRAGIKVNNEGNVFITDTYDFNDRKEGVTYSDLHKVRPMWPGVKNRQGQKQTVGGAAYALARNTGGVLGSKDGQGAPVSIFVGNVNDLNFEEEELNTLRKNFKLNI